MTLERLQRVHQTARRLIGQSVWWTDVDWTRSTSKDDTGSFVDDQRQVTDDLKYAEVVSSEVRGSPLHNILIDLDVPAVVIPSSTPGHGHLYIDKPMVWEDVEKLLAVMVEIGLVEPGHLAASKQRRATFLRLPWIHKGRERHERPFTPEEAEAFLAVELPPEDPFNFDPWANSNPSPDVPF